MRRVALLIALLAVLAVAHSQATGDGGGQTVRAAAPGQAAAPAVHPAAPPDGALVQKYCVTCHSDRLKTGGLSLQNVDAAARASLVISSRLLALATIVHTAR